jgi:hypothetical protein
MTYFVTEEEMNEAIERNSEALLSAVSKFNSAEKNEFCERLSEVEGRLNIRLQKAEAGILKTILKLLEEANFKAEGNAGQSQPKEDELKG